MALSQIARTQSRKLERLAENQKDFIQNKDSLEIYSIHMDAPIYPGSSGGPLFYKGKVVGVNYAGHTDTTLNFSIHFNVAKRFIK